MNDDTQNVFLVYPTPEGSRQIAIEGESLTLGRGAVDLRFDDASLSRHHATVYRQAERVWILDENSTNGTFVNGAAVAPAGTPLCDGDSVRLGDETTLRVRIVRQQEKSAAAIASPGKFENASNSNFVLLIVAGIACFVIALSAIVVGARFVYSNGDNKNLNAKLQTPDIKPEETPDGEETNSAASPTPKPSVSLANSALANETPTPDENDAPPAKPPAPSKTYAQMADAERRQFIEQQALQIARTVANRSGERSVPPEAVTRIKKFADDYAGRLRSGRNDACSGTDCTAKDLRSLLERGKASAPFIVRAFNSEGLAPQLGIYLAMIESEFYPCLRSRTGPLGMFQLAFDAAKESGLNPVRGASPANPDVRCIPEQAAPGAARYMRGLIGRYGTGALSVPLAIASYNSGAGDLSKNLSAALAAEAGQERSFWTLVANEGKLTEQFKSENVKYVPKFFAAAIIGENPTVFGVNMPPLSSNTK